MLDIPGYERIPLSDDTRFIATMNHNYAGTRELNEALLSRFAVIRICLLYTSRAIVDAHNKGFDENMYLDAATRTKVEETGGANFIFVTKDGTVVTPKSDSILPSITRRSLMYVAEHYLEMCIRDRS